MFISKPIEGTKWAEILEYSKTHGAYSTSKKYAKEVNWSMGYLYRKLGKLQKKGSETVEEETPVKNGEGDSKIISGYRARAIGRKEAYEGITLTAKEKKLISDIAEGKVDLETASRVIASKAFEKLLKFPDSASFTSFIQAELLKLKRQELTDKNTWAMELINRMFAGELPPRICPKCGEVLVKLPALEGEIVEDVESISLTGSN